MLRENDPLPESYGNEHSHMVVPGVPCGDTSEVAEDASRLVDTVNSGKTDW